MEIDPLDEHPGTEHNTHPATTPAGTRVHSDHHGEGVVISSDEYYLVVEFAHGPETVSPFGLTVIDAPTVSEGGMAPAPTQSDYERRGRRAKAQALATVLADTSITPGEALVTPLGSATWKLAAEVATRRGLLGEGVTVHPPHSAETVQAVAERLRVVLFERTRRNSSEAVHGAHSPQSEDATPDPDAMKARTTPGVVFNHPTHGTMTVVGESYVDHRYVMARKGDNTPGRAIPIRKSEMRTLAQASAGYRQHLSAVAPHPETTEADLTAFDGFPR
jgi:hypothetical protein